MLVFLRTPIGRWIAISLLLPLIATGLSALGRFLQRRSGHPTRISKAVLGISTFVDKRLNRNQPPPPSADPSSRDRVAVRADR